jgi:hypothetical protein
MRLAALDGHQRQHVRVLAHLRARMPQHVQVAAPPRIGGGYHVGIVERFHSPIIAPAHPT